MPQRHVVWVLAVPGRLALEIHEFPLTTHLARFSRHGVPDTVTARILYTIAFCQPALLNGRKSRQEARQARAWAKLRKAGGQS